jgi:hypothetical protein
MAAIDVLTNRYNPERTGANPHEPELNQANVNVNGFGKIFSRGDGQIYAQPLIVSDLDLGAALGADRLYSSRLPGIKFTLLTRKIRRLVTHSGDR